MDSSTNTKNETCAAITKAHVQICFPLIPTNHVAWMAKVGVAVAEADSPIGQSQQIDILVGGDKRPVSLPDAIHT